MKKNWKASFKMMLHHEGGFVNHPDDPGGATNLGVTKRVYQEYLGRHVSMSEMKALTVEDVEPLYRQRYWDACKCDDLPGGVDWAVFDWAVNGGTGRAAKHLQEAIGVKVDGAIGPMTLGAATKADPAKTVQDIHDIRQAYYESRSHWDKFGKGWTRRNKETLEAAKKMISKK